MSQFSTVVYLDGKPVKTSRNLRGLLEYGRAPHSAPYRIKANPCPNNPHNGRLFVEYSNGATCAAFFRDYSCLLDWLASRRNWRTAPFWDIAKPEKEGGPMQSAALAKLTRLGLMRA